MTKNKRQLGYYWVKRTAESEWSVFKYLGDNDWYEPGSEYFVGDQHIYLINETRILNPDEK
jgi:hypothetical protein